MLSQRQVCVWANCHRSVCSLKPYCHVCSLRGRCFAYQVRQPCPVDPSTERRLHGFKTDTHMLQSITSRRRARRAAPAPRASCTRWATARVMRGSSRCASSSGSATTRSWAARGGWRGACAFFVCILMCVRVGVRATVRSLPRTMCIPDHMVRGWAGRQRWGGFEVWCPRRLGV